MADTSLYDRLGQGRNPSFDDDDLELPELRPKPLDNSEETMYSLKNRNSAGDLDDFNDDTYLLARDKSEDETNSPIPMVAAVISKLQLKRIIRCYY